MLTVRNSGRLKIMLKLIWEDVLARLVNSHERNGY